MDGKTGGEVTGCERAEWSLSCPGGCSQSDDFLTSPLDD